MQVIRYNSEIDLGVQYGPVIVPTVTETNAIVISAPDVAGPTSVASNEGNTQATLYLDFTKGSLTNVSVKIYGSYLASPTANDWYQETVETDAVGVATLDPFSIVLTATARIAYHFPLGAYRTIRITVQGNGTATSSLMKLNLGLRNN